MKLSTFVKKLTAKYKKEQKSSPKDHHYLCTAARNLHISLYQNTTNTKLQTEYLTLANLCKEFISKAIHGKDTVRQYLVTTFKYSQEEISDWDLYPECHAFRLNLLNDMLDWAIAQEESHQQ